MIETGTILTNAIEGLVLAGLWWVERKVNQVHGLVNSANLAQVQKISDLEDKINKLEREIGSKRKR